MSLNNKNLAKDYLNEASFRVETAENVITKKAYAYCVHQCQEAVELNLKCSLFVAFYY